VLVVLLLSLPDLTAEMDPIVSAEDRQR